MYSEDPETARVIENIALGSGEVAREQINYQNADSAAWVGLMMVRRWGTALLFAEFWVLVVGLVFALTANDYTTDWYMIIHLGTLGVGTAFVVTSKGVISSANLIIGIALFVGIVDIIIVAFRFIDVNNHSGTLKHIRGGMIAVNFFFLLLDASYVALGAVVANIVGSVPQAEISYEELHRGTTSQRLFARDALFGMRVRELRQSGGTVVQSTASAPVPVQKAPPSPSTGMFEAIPAPGTAASYRYQPQEFQGSHGFASLDGHALVGVVPVRLKHR